VFREPPGSYDICPICNWEDDLSQLRFVTSWGGANAPSLIEAQKNYLEFGAAEVRFRDQVRAPMPGDRRVEGWIPFDPSRHIVEDSVPGTDYSDSYPDDATVLYYWLRKHA
jgi:hypothetical protein